MWIKPLLLAQVAVLAFSGSLFGGLNTEIQIACSLSIQQIGFLMSLGQIGSFISFLCFPLLAKKFGAYLLLVGGVFGFSVTLIGMGLSRSALLFGSFFLLNALAGYLYGTSNVMVLLKMEPQRKNFNIPLMHLVFSIASIFSGIFITFLKRTTWYYGYLVVGFAFFVLGVLFLKVRPKESSEWGKTDFSSMHSSFSLLHNPAYVRYLFFLIVANAVEFSSTVYPLLFLTENLHSEAKDIGLAISLLYTGSTISRFSAIPLLKKGVNAGRYLFFLSMLCLVGLFALALSPSLLIASFSLVLIGLGIGAVNPVSQVFEITRWPDDVMQLSNLRSIGSVVGKMLMPFILTLVIASSSLPWAFVTLASALVLAILPALSVLLARS